MAGLIKRIATVSAILTQGTGRYKDGVEIINEYPCKVFPTENFTQIFANSNPIQSDTAFLVPSMLIKPRLPATLIITIPKNIISLK